MPIETIEFNQRAYPAFQAEGNAAQFALPFAQKLCRGVGYDIGCNRAQWSLPGSILIDPAIDPSHDACSLPALQVDYIFSSHCLEHLPNWVDALNHWYDKLKEGGVLFLYLPNMQEQEYWRPWNNRKHVHFITPGIISDYLHSKNNSRLRPKWINIFVSGTDLNSSFYAVAQKQKEV